MRIRTKAKALASGAGVALATSGLSSCHNNGAVDPPPPPFECTAGVGDGTILEATGTLAGTMLAVMFTNRSPSQWTAAEVTAVVGGVARPVQVANPLVVVIDLTEDGMTGGSFTLSGTVRGYGGTSCAVTRTFRFTIGPSGVTVASADDLPLSERHAAHIAVRSREGHDVELEATTPFSGPANIRWTVTGGRVVAQDGKRMSWRLPEEPGLYQAQLVIDYGSGGLSFDALAFEVG
jgi:hypothetical protein